MGVPRVFIHEASWIKIKKRQGPTAENSYSARTVHSRPPSPEYITLLLKATLLTPDPYRVNTADQQDTHTLISLPFCAHPHLSLSSSELLFLPSHLFCR